jgi:hypothetical protein
MDDGSFLSGRKSQIATCGFSTVENELFVTALKNKYNIASYTRMQRKKYPILVVDAAEFHTLIEPYIVPSMLYKLNKPVSPVVP